MNGLNHDAAPPLPERTADSYRRALLALADAGVPHLVGGAFALAVYAGIIRHTKDLDVFVRPVDRDRALSALMSAGFSTRIVFPFWLAKAFAGEDMVDLIYRSPDGVTTVDDGWFARGKSSTVVGVAGRLCAAEDVLLAKIFILNNDRNDLADVVHLIYSLAERLDWNYLLQAVGSNWRVLLAQLVLFGFIYPSERRRIPDGPMQTLVSRLQEEMAGPAPTERICLGTLLSHSQYRVDVQTRGFDDGRLQPRGSMSPQDIFDATISTEDPQRR